MFKGDNLHILVSQVSGLVENFDIGIFSDTINVKTLHDGTIHWPLPVHDTLSDATLLCFAYYSIQKSKTYNVSIWSDQNMNLIYFFHADQRTLRLWDGLEQDICIQNEICVYRVTGHAAGSLHLDCVKQVAA